MSVLDMLVHNDHIIIASEYAEGGSLKKWLSQSDGRAPSHEKALEMMTGILSGIEHLHSRNVVHRDLKPDNILLQGNFPRITDFGISRIISAGSMSTVAMGSPFYMSPESFDGSKSTQTDIWSAGVILYEMLTGEHPYRSETIFGLVSAIRQNIPKPLPDNIPAGIRNVVETALQKDLAIRYQTAQDMRSAIEQQLYEIKLRSQGISTDPENAKFAPPLSDPNATLIDRYIDNSALNAPQVSYETIHDAPIPVIKAKEADTEVLNVDKPVGETSLADYIRETPILRDPALDRSAEQLQGQQISYSDQPAQEKVEPVPLYERSAATVPAVLGASGSQEFEPSPFSQTRKPLMLLGGIGGLVVLGGVFAVVAVIALVLMTRSMLFKQPQPEPAAVASKSNVQNTRPSPGVPAGMSLVPGGEFMMGRDDGQVLEERPAHKVTVNPFYIDVHEVTNEEFAQFVKEMRHKPPQGWRGEDYPSGEGNYPVVGVNWNDANEFAKWKGKRLPAEEEWEFAARGTESRLYPWGNEWTPGQANVDGASASFAEVGRFKGESPFGIFDMLGNAWEWTASDFKAYQGGSLSAVYAGRVNLKAIRGGDFSATRAFATTAYRLGWAATGGQTYNRLGFRCAKDVSE
jgi:formylglycine-generating enzyme required for sulfatase activity/tRNA A-37 threonylcarbamoyl transferase component Bud32